MAEALQTWRLRIAPRAPFRLDLTAWALRRRAHNQLDRWDGRVYRRALLLDGTAATVAVRQTGPPDAPRLAVTVDGRAPRAPAQATVRAALDRLLGLQVDLGGFAALAARDPLLAPLAARLRGLKPPRFASVFEALLNAVACQQLSLAVGIHLLNRLAAAYGSPAPGGLRAVPSPLQLARADPRQLRGLGFSATKSQTIVQLARALAQGTLDLESLAQQSDELAAERLRALHGIGRWSAEYVLLRGLGRLQVFPGDDVGARNRLERFCAPERKLDYAAVRALLDRWQPYAGMVYFHLLLDSLAEAGLLGAQPAR